MSALLSFLGGSAFRAIWGEIAGWVQRQQEHKHEVEMADINAKAEADRHQRSLESMRLQNDLGIKTIQIKADADIALSDAQAFALAMESANKPTGIRWVDAWNGLIRPLAASIAILLWVFALNEQGFKMGDWDKELVGVILGFYFAHRVFQK